MAWHIEGKRQESSVWQTSLLIPHQWQLRQIRLQCERHRFKSWSYRKIPWRRKLPSQYSPWQSHGWRSLGKALLSMGLLKSNCTSDFFTIDSYISRKYFNAFSPFGSTPTWVAKHSYDIWDLQLSCLTFFGLPFCKQLFNSSYLCVNELKAELYKLKVDQENQRN